MLIKTILNECYKFKSFVYQQVKLASYQGTEVIDVTIIPLENTLALCSCCGQPAPGYDSLSERRFEFMPLWGTAFPSYTPCVALLVEGAGSRLGKCPGPTTRKN